MNPIFIGACGRSGTTMLAAMLAQRPDVVMPPEAQFLIEALAQSDDAAGFVTAARRSWRFQLWQLRDDGELRQAEQRAVGVADVMRVWARNVKDVDPQVSYWVDHTPWNVHYAHTLLELFPSAHLVHLVRDPRAVVASVLPLDWGPASARQAAQWWLARIAAGLAAEAAYPGRVHRLHYEALVRAPEGTVADLETRLGLAGPGSTGAADRPSHDAGLAAYTRSQHALVGLPPDASRADAWRGQLSEQQVRIIEGEVGGCLSLLGYDPVSPRPALRVEPTVHEIVGQARRRLGKGVRRRSRRRAVLRGT